MRKTTYNSYLKKQIEENIMKFTLSWLKDHLDTNANLEEITTTLTAIGLEVEGVEDLSAQFAPFKVAHVISAEKHPDADRLKVCKVDTGEGTVQVVCGAPNARTGMKAIFAPVGSYIPGLDVELKKGVIRGEASEGMLVSEREMCLSDAHEGIIDLDDKWDIGTPMATIFGLDDPVIDIAITPNRADCTGVRGIARDLAVAGLGKLKPLKAPDIKSAFKSDLKISLDFDKETKDACPHFLGRTIRNVKNGNSPAWMQKRLKAIGLRPISALVDVTNYLSYDLCRPLHVFDTDKLSGDITVRLSKLGEKLEALDEKTYTLDDGMTVVCDESGIIGLGGVMGGEATGCTEETTSVTLECAYFDPMRTARTGRALGINSDARYRFERGIDPAFTAEGMDIATQLILDICGGEASEVVVAGQTPDHTRTISFNPERTTRLLGIEIDDKTQEKILTDLGFEVSRNSKSWEVTPPSWRDDIDGAADLVEEVGRIHGYDSIAPHSLPPLTLSYDTALETVNFKMGRLARAALTTMGYNECVTWSFVSDNLAQMFGANNNSPKKDLKLLNPISQEMATMRPSALPNLIEAASNATARSNENGRFFEIGPIFKSGKADGYQIAASGLLYGKSQDRHWASDQVTRDVDMYDAKADCINALEACGCPVGNLQIEANTPDYYHPGRSGCLRLGKNVIGYFGEIHPAILQDMDIDFPIMGFEFFFDALPPQRKKGTTKKALTLSSLQPVNRDFAFVVDQDVTANDVIRAAYGADKNMITHVDIFDVYAGKGIAEGQKSLAVTVTLQPQQATLTDKEIDAISEKIVSQVKEKTNATLRG